MAATYILSIDQGTTGSKVLLFEKNRIVAQAYQEIPQHFPQSGWVEHNPEAIWQSVIQLIAKVIDDVPAQSIAGIAITNQRETVVVWDGQTGQPLAPAVVWQCRRSADICQQLVTSGYDDIVRAKTGLKIDPYFSGTKLTWLADNIPDLATKARQGRVLWGTMDTWLLFKLTGGQVFATDYSNASRTLLYNIYDMRWDTELSELLGVADFQFPAVLPSSHCYGKTVTVGGLPSGIPICSLIGDSQAALFGEGCLTPGMAKATYGTGTSLLMYTGTEPVEPPDGLVATLSWGVEDQVGYALEGIINVTGATMQWLRDGLEIIEDPATSQAIAESLANNDGVYIVPAFVGLGAPYWDMDARGIITGLTRGTTRAHLIRAALESTAYQVWDVVELMQKGSGTTMTSLRADGGASHNAFLMQFQADLLGVEVVLPAIREVSALGAAYLAGLALGLWTDTKQIAQQWQAHQVFRPKMNTDERHQLIAEWRSAVQQALTRSEH